MGTLAQWMKKSNSTRVEEKKEFRDYYYLIEQKDSTKKIYTKR